MSKIKLQATDGNGGTISLKGPTTTDGNAEFELTLPANDGSANEYLKTNGSGVLSWATATPEGTSVKSTGESGGTKYLREDGDGTCSWQTVSAGTALTGSTNNTITTVTGANAIQGEANLTFDGSTLQVNKSGPTTVIDGADDLIAASSIVCYSTNDVANTRNGISFAGADHTEDGCNAGIIANHENVTENSEATSLSFYVTGNETLNEALKINTDGTVTVAGHVKQDGGFGIMEPCFNATMGDDVACFDQTWTKNDRWQNEGTGMNPGWDSTNDKFTVPTGGAGHYLFIWTIQLGDGHQNHLDEEEILDTILRKNGTDIAKSKNRSPGTVNDWFHVTGSYSCELADGDYIEMYHWHNEGGRLDIDDASCSFMGFRIAEGD